MRRNPATVVILAGLVTQGLLNAVGGSMNVALVRPESPDADDRVGAAAGALRRAAGVSSPYVLVAADPLAAVAAEWEAMWRIGADPPAAGSSGTGSAGTTGPAGARSAGAGSSAGAGQRGTSAFELRAGEALAAWRAREFDLPDYYLVVADQAAPDERPPDFYLGPLRSVRPHRVAAVAADGPAERAAAVTAALGSLRHGRWWPPLDDVVETARGFYPGALAESPGTGKPQLLA